MKLEVNFHSGRVAKAKARAQIGDKLGKAFYAAAFVLAAAAAFWWLFSDFRRLSYFLLALALLSSMFALWYSRELKKIPPVASPENLDDILEPGLLAGLTKQHTFSPQALWQVATKRWEAAFIFAHLQINKEAIAQILPPSGLSDPAWLGALKLMEEAKIYQLDSAALAASLMANSRPVLGYLAKQNLRIEDVYEAYFWLERFNKYIGEEKPYFGGFGRDWAAGFTPTLDQYSQNISAEVEAGNVHFHTLAHSEVLDTLVQNLDEHGVTTIVGNAGTGKTSLVYGLAERLLKGQDKGLLYYHILSLDASAILSDNGQKLERIMLQLFAEAAHARNIIIFLDEAQLFFGEGMGAFDMSKLLLPVVQNKVIKIIAAFTPDDFQQLKNSNQSLSSMLNPINIKEPLPNETLKILEDTALTFEARSGALITFQAVKEAVRLSGQYMQELAFPGKAIRLLEQSITHAENKIVGAEAVQQAIEVSQGVKVAKAEGPETDLLLHLEEKIHARMVNQERAVNVVASALRRGRAGVADPKRPIGSFLFLGPTGVGKTELARSLAAVYFGDQNQMVRLDMSEYQTPNDVERLLDAGGSNTKSLILHIREQPFSVVLLDEVEKAHPNILNLLLQMLDEGQLSDQSGKAASFKNAIIITTSNAGSAEIAQHVASGDTLDNLERPLVNALIAADTFKAELINRFDEVVLFRPLGQNELAQVAKIMLAEVNKVIARQNITVQLTDSALFKLVQAGYDPQFGARPMRRVIQQTVENAVATRILQGQAEAGSVVTLDAADLQL